MVEVTDSDWVERQNLVRMVIEKDQTLASVGDAAVQIMLVGEVVVLEAVSGLVVVNVGKVDSSVTFLVRNLDEEEDAGSFAALLEESFCKLGAGLEKASSLAHSDELRCLVKYVWIGLRRHPRKLLYVLDEDFSSIERLYRLPSEELHKVEVEEAEIRLAAPEPTWVLAAADGDVPPHRFLAGIRSCLEQPDS